MKQTMETWKTVLVFVASATLNGFCADTNSAPTSAPVASTSAVSYAPAVLPGKGLAQHSFLYTGEWDYRKTDQTMFVVRGGKVVWTYSIPIKDADGTVQVLEVTPEKKIVWALSEWKDPDLGPASSIQLLDEPGAPEIPGEQQR